MEVAHHQIDSVSFAVYSTPEIKRMSVLEITNPQTFDLLNQATPKGLCDNALGN